MKTGHDRVARGGSALVDARARAAGSSDDSGGSAVASNDEPVTLRFQSLAFQKTTVAATKKIVADWNAANPTSRSSTSRAAGTPCTTSWSPSSRAAPRRTSSTTSPPTSPASRNQGYLADLSPYLSQETSRTPSRRASGTRSPVDGKVVAAPTLLQSYVVFAQHGAARSRPASTSRPATRWSWDDFAGRRRRSSPTGGKYGLGWGLKSPTATVMNLG